MEKLKLSSLESLLRFSGTGENQVVPDASVLSCGCLVSESEFRLSATNKCPNGHHNVYLLADIGPLRELYTLVEKVSSQLQSSKSNRRRSSSKKSVHNACDSAKAEPRDLMGLFYEFAKEEVHGSDTTAKEEPKAAPIDIYRKETKDSSSVAISFSPEQHYTRSFSEAKSIHNENKEKNILKNLNEMKEYNFSKCFPFYRKYSSFNSSPLKLNFASMTISPFKSTSSVLKKSTRFIASDLCTFFDFETNREITRYVLLAEKRWELYESSISVNDFHDSDAKPVLICCGKSTGEFGPNFDRMMLNDSSQIVLKNDFAVSAQSNTNNDELNRKLQQWTFVSCNLSMEKLVISGTRGMQRTFNIKAASKYLLGQPIYTYSTNFPIRCTALAPNDSLIASGVTAKEKHTGKEQPLIILQKLNLNEDGQLMSVDPITITMPHRDPIKLLEFDSSSTHIISCTSWEYRYSIIRIRSGEISDNYRKPRLVWSDADYLKNNKKSETEDFEEGGDDSKINEGVTSIQFGFANTLILASCSLKNRPPEIIKLYRTSVDRGPDSSTFSETHSGPHSYNSKHEPVLETVKSFEVLMKLSEVGTLIHKFCLSPRGDAIAFLSKDGSIFIVSNPNLYDSSSSNRRTVVLLGDVASAERYQESASVKFSSDGGKVYAIDRKGIYSVYDFTKGMPGRDSDVLKCKIISA